MSSELRMKKLISDALLKLLEDKSIDCIATSEIVDAAGISKRTFYNHFSDKHAVFLWWWDEQMKPFFEADLDVYALNLFKALKTYRKQFQHVLCYKGQNNFLDDAIPHDVVKYKMHLRKDVLENFAGDLLVNFTISTAWFFFSFCLGDEAQLDRMIFLLTNCPDEVLIKGAYYAMGDYLSYKVLPSGEHI